MVRLAQRRIPEAPDRQSAPEEAGIGRSSLRHGSENKVEPVNVQHQAPRNELHTVADGYSGHELAMAGDEDPEYVPDFEQKTTMDESG